MAPGRWVKGQVPLDEKGVVTPEAEGWFQLVVNYWYMLIIDVSDCDRCYGVPAYRMCVGRYPVLQWVPATSQRRKLRRQGPTSNVYYVQPWF